MPNQKPSTAVDGAITKYEVLFAIRTGVTILLPKVPAFDCGPELPITFKISPDNPRDIIITADTQTVTLKNLQKPHLDAAVSRGFVMFYEMEDDEVTRCTHCSYQK